MRDSVRTVMLEIPDDLERAFKVIKELRMRLEFEEFKRLVLLAHAADGYRLVAREIGPRLVAVMGYRILHDLAHGSHLYVDDLVTAKDFRSQGHGAELLRYAEAEARRFYEREDWSLRSVAFKKKVSTH